jgi:hypothetical protein
VPTTSGCSWWAQPTLHLVPSPIKSTALACLGFGPAAHAQQRAYRLPETDIRQQTIWGSTCETPDGRGLAFGGQDQQADDGPAHTHIKVEVEHGSQPATPRGAGHSCGLMYDAKRQLIWGVNTYERRVYVLRLDRQAADLDSL